MFKNISLARASVLKVIFPKSVWDDTMRMPSLLGRMKISVWPDVRFLRFTLDFFLQKGKTAHLFLTYKQFLQIRVKGFEYS